MKKEERLEKRTKFIAQYDNFDTVFSFENLYAAYKKCIQKVSWKTSVQKFIADDITNLTNLETQLKQGTFKSKGFHEFDIIERGKPRHIKSVDIEERIVQRCLCDNCLVPVLTRNFIYDNGACVPHKGQHFTINRLKRHIREYYNRYGVDGYALTLDFKSYFDNIEHKVVYDLVDNTFNDPKIVALIHHFVDAFGDKGLGLGSQVSQILAVAVANPLDHYVKERLHVRWYGRYNDDSWYICRTREEAKEVAQKVVEFCNQYGFIIHPNKVKIRHLRQGFKFMKIKFTLKPTGYIMMLPDRKKVVQARRRLKKIKRKIDNGELTNHDGFLSWQGWDANISICDAYEQRKEIKMLAKRLFGRHDFDILDLNRKIKNKFTQTATPELALFDDVISSE